MHFVTQDAHLLNFYDRHTLFYPRRADQVSKANLRSKQGGINFTPFVPSLPYSKKYMYDIVTTWVTEGTMLSNQVSPIT
jgi:hypothetical protein